MRRVAVLLLLLLPVAVARAEEPRIVGHRGLIHFAPENTLAGFAACVELRVGFELDVRMSKDGHLVVMHDADVKRTTGGAGKVSELTLAELRKLDAGAQFDPAFVGQRVPTLDEVFALLKDRKSEITVALDLKSEESALEADVVKLAVKHGVLGQVVCIGRAIEEAEVRKKLRATDAKTPIAVLAKTADDLGTAIEEPNADWIYVRFIPNPEQVTKVHKAGKKLFLSGPQVIQAKDPVLWRQARNAGVDLVLTDHPLKCREALREMKKP